MDAEVSQAAAIRRSTVTTVLVMGCTALSRLLGFLRIAVIGAVFGASGVADVWNAVFTIPNNLRKLMAEGALSSAFIPSLSGALHEDGSGAEARALTRKILTLQLVILVPLLGLAVVLARPVITTLLSFPQAAKMELSVSLFRWVFAYLLFVSLSAVLMAVLNSHYVFVVPAITPVLFSITVIASTLMLHRQLGVFSMAVGVLAGGVAQILFQLPRYLRLGYDFRLDFGFRAARFRAVVKAWAPVLISASIFALTEQIAVLLASGLEDGSTSALSYALVFFQLPFGIFSISVVTVLFPRMSRQAAAGDREGMADSLSYGLRFIFVLLVPAAIVLAMMGREIIAVALQRREFTAEGTLRTSKVLAAYSLGLFSVGGFTFLQRFFYSHKDFLSPLLGAAVVSVVDVGLSLWLKETALRVTGLAVANSAAFTAGLALMLVMARRYLGKLKGGQVWKTVARVAASMVPLALLLWVYRRVTASLWAPGSTLGNLALLLGAVGTGALVVLGMYWITRVEVLRTLAGRRRAG